MQRIETQAQKEAREKRRARIISYFLLGIMVLSTAGYALLSYTGTSQPASAPDGTDPFGRSPIDVNGQTLYLTTPVKETSNISVEIRTTLRDYTGTTFYLSSEDPAVFYEISSTLGTFTSKIQEACYGLCDKNLPERNCSQQLLVVNTTALPARVYQENQCIFIDGDIRSVDAFLYRLLSTP